MIRMSRQPSVVKTLISLFLSATMALPATSFARNDDVPQKPAITEDTPTVFETGYDQEGRAVTKFAFPVTAENEAEVVTSFANLAKDKPNIKVGMMFGGQDDPAFQTVKKTGLFGRIKAWFAPKKAEDIPAIRDAKESSEERTQTAEDIKKLERKARNVKILGLAFGYIYAGLLGGGVYYSSSSVPMALGIFTMYAAWNTFLLTKSKTWDRTLEWAGSKTGNGYASVMNKYGYQVDEYGREAVGVIGKFGLTWAINTAQAAAVMYASGTMTSLGTLEGLVLATMGAISAGFMNNYSIVDAVVFKSNANGGWFSDNRRDWYFRMQMVGGGTAESLAFQGVGAVEPVLFGITILGTVHLILHPKYPAFRKTCAGLLTAKPQKRVYQASTRHQYEDTW